MFCSEEANFLGMTGSKNATLFVSKAIQKAFIEVNEDETEAAAASATEMTYGFSMKKTSLPYEFKCDRPFMFLIKDNLTGMILFSGQVVDPSLEAVETGLHLPPQYPETALTPLWNI